MADSAEFISSSAAIVDSAGATMVETMMRLKPVVARTSVTAHLRPVGQSLGLSVSYGSAKTTRNRSLSLLALLWIAASSTSVGGTGVMASGITERLS